MNPYTAIVVQRHLEQLRADAAEHRLARAAVSAPSRRSRLAAASASLRANGTRSGNPSSVAPA